MFSGMLSAAFLYQPHNSGCLLQPVCSHLSQAGTACGTWVACAQVPAAFPRLGSHLSPGSQSVGAQQQRPLVRRGSRFPSSQPATTRLQVGGLGLSNVHLGTNSLQVVC